MNNELGMDEDRMAIANIVLKAFADFNSDKKLKHLEVLDNWDMVFTVKGGRKYLVTIKREV